MIKKGLVVLIFLFMNVFLFAGEKPELNLPEGEYFTDIVVDLPQDVHWQYRFIDYSTGSFIPYSIPLSLTAVPGEKREYNIEIYDSLLTSTVYSYHFIINKKQINLDEIASLDSSFNLRYQQNDLVVVNPIAGNFSNKQLLFIDNPEDFLWVKYSLDGSDPSLSGQVYTEAVLLDTFGETQLTLVASTRNNNLIRKVITFTVNNISDSFTSIEGGLYDQDLVLSFPEIEEPLSYTFGNDIDKRSSIPLSDSILLRGIEGGRQNYALNIFTHNPVNLYRDIYVIDKSLRVNQSANVLLDYRIEREGLSQVNVVLPTESTYLYTLSQGDYEGITTSSNRLEEVLKIEVPYGMEEVFYLLIGNPGANEEPLVKEVLHIDNKPPQPPIIENIDNKLVLSGDENIFYSIDFSAFSLYSGAIDLSVDDYPNHYHEYMVRAYSQKENGAFSGGAQATITIDQRIPVIEEIQGLPSSGISTLSLDLKPLASIEGCDFYYEISVNGIAEDPQIDSSTLMTKSIILDQIPQQEISYSVKILPVYRSLLGEVYEFNVVIDSLPPQLPIVSGLPSSEVAHPVSILITPIDSQDMVHSRIVIDEEERIYNGNRLTIEDSAILYISVVDRAGNTVNMEPFQIIIESQKPLQPRPLLTSINHDEALVYSFSLEEEEGTTVYYEIDFDSKMPSYPSIDSLQYEDSIVVQLQGGEKRINLRTTAVDRWGNISKENQIFSLEVENFEETEDSLSLEVISENFLDIPYEVRSNSSISIHPDSRYLVRYEIGSSENFPGYIDLTSPVMDSELIIDLLDGEEKELIIAAKAFDLEGTGALSQEYFYYINLDRKKPLPPLVLFDVLEGNKQVRVTLDTKGETGFYRLGSSSFTESTGNYQSYTDSFILDVPNGIDNELIIDVYSEDVLGNKSSIEEWEYTVEELIVYVSPEGNDYYGGTKEFPVRTLQKAIFLAKQEKKNTIYLSSGIYIVSQPLVIDESISIRGGFTKDEWLSSQEMSIIKKSSEFQGSLIEIRDSFSTLSNLSFSNEIVNYNKLITLSSGTLHLTGLDFPHQINRVYDSVIQQNGGSLKLSKMNIDISSTGNFCFLNSSAGKLNISELTIAAATNLGDINLFRLSNLDDILIEDSLIIANGGNYLTPFKFDTCSSVNVLRSKIRTDNTALTARNIKAINSQLLLQESSLVSGDSNHIAILFSLNAGSAVVEDTLFDLTSDAGSTGLSGRQTDININRCQINAIKSPNEFIYPFVLAQSTFSGTNNLITFSPTRDFALFKSTDSEVSFIHNTVVIDESSNTLFIEDTGDSGNLTFVNNILSVNKRGGFALFLKTGRSLVEDLILNNNLYGFSFFIRGDTPIQTILDFNLMDRDHFSGNISDNFIEDPTNALDENYRLKTSSLCLNRGRLINIPLFPSTDFEMEARPSLDEINPRPDVGFDEY